MKYLAFLIFLLPAAASLHAITPEKITTMRKAFRGGEFMASEGVTEATEVYKAIGDRKLEMQLHFPPGWKADDKRPVMIFFFGGGWNGGTTDQFLVQADYFASKGIVTARADYRVKSRDGVTPYQCSEDARSAVRWLRKHSGELGIDPEKLISSGGSAGGHLAYAVSIKNGADDPTDDKKISSIPQAMVLYNPAMFPSNTESAKSRMGTGPDALKQLKRIAPLDHVYKSNPPALIMFGTNDGLKAGGDEYVKRAKEAGVRAEMWIAEGQKHSFFNEEPWRTKTTQAVEEFLSSLGYLK